MKRLGVGFLAVLFTFSAYAAKNGQTVVLTQPTQVGSTTLPAGPVKVSWTGTGANAQVTLAPGGKNPVTIPAQVVDEKHAEASVGTIDLNGTTYLQDIELSNVKLVIPNTDTVAAASGR
jgi:hypothetical protein